MPNHIQNKIIFDCEEEKLKSILAELGTHTEEENTDFDFNKVIPMPENIFKGALGTAERNRYGKNNWYDWSIENWGTKWNAYETHIEDGTLYFWTAWEAPHPVIEALARKYPDVHIRHEWADEDLGRNCGTREYEDGEITMEYLPADIQSGLRLALCVWGYEPEDIGMTFNAKGELVEIEDNPDIKEIFDKANNQTGDINYVLDIDEDEHIVVEPRLGNDEEEEGDK